MGERAARRRCAKWRPLESASVERGEKIFCVRPQAICSAGICNVVKPRPILRDRISEWISAGIRDLHIGVGGAVGHCEYLILGSLVHLNER